MDRPALIRLSSADRRGSRLPRGLPLPSPGAMRCLGIAALAASISCGGSGSGSAVSTPLTLAGSSTVQPLAEVLAERYQVDRPEVTIDVQGGGSSVGVSSVRTGLADIGMVSRDLLSDENDLTPVVIALDGVAFIVHETNPVEGLKSDQVVGLYTGAVESWSEVGGADAPVVLINKEEGRATLEVVEQQFGLRGRFARNAVIIGPNGQAIATVAGNPHAIAYVSIGAAEAARGQGTPIRLLRLDGVEPTVENVRRSTYPVMRSLLLVTATPPSEQARKFIEFVLRPEGQKIVVEEGFVPVPEPCGR